MKKQCKKIWNVLDFHRSKVSNKKTIPMSRQVKRKQRIIEAIDHVTKTDVNLSQSELIAKVQKYVNDDQIVHLYQK